MYVIKVNEDKSLTTTVQSAIYKNEHGADTLCFLIPKSYNGISFEDGDMKICYTLPDGSDMSESLDVDGEGYKSYNRYHLKVTTNLTSMVGKIRVWLEFTRGEDDALVFKTGHTFITIHDTDGDEEDKDGCGSGGGTHGKDGITPHIGDNNHWFIGSEDTGISAVGKDGYTPVIGKDFWTEDDKKEIKSYVENAILGGAW